MGFASILLGYAVYIKCEEKSDLLKDKLSLFGPA